MWTNPRYPELRPPPPAAPEPTGQHVLTLDRSHGGRHEELRVTLDEFESHPYVNLRVWAEIDGAWYPVKGKGCSIRLRELVPLADALRAVATALDRDRPRPVRATLHQARRERVESPRPLLEGPPRVDFDEFGRHT